MRKLASGVAAVAAVAVIAGCGSSSSSSTTTSSTTSAPAASSSTTTATSASSSTAASTGGVTIDAKPVKGLGTVLVNASGKTLYMFVPDKDAKVTCTGPCASVWPPVKIAAGDKAAAGAGVKASLLGSDPDPSGGDVVTYAGWPLYTYVGDSAPGAAGGQGLDINGGLWYVLSAAGKIVKTKP